MYMVYVCGTVKPTLKVIAFNEATTVLGLRRHDQNSDRQVNVTIILK